MNVKEIGRTLAAGCLTLAAITFVGCERKEKLIDIETPRREIEVERNKDTGDVNVDVIRKKDESER